MSHAVVISTPDHTDRGTVRLAIRNTPLLRGLDDRLTDRLAAISQIVAVPQGAEICRQAESADVLFVVLDGQVAASSGGVSNGTAAVVEIIRPGGTIGLASLLGRLPRLLTARAIGPCRLLTIDAKGLLALVEQETALVAVLLRQEAEDFQALVSQVRDLKLLTTAQRLVCFLLSLCGETAGNTATLRLPFDKRLLAARLGCRQENLSRAFAGLRSLGVETHGARVILHDIAKLRDYARPDSQPAA
jgi:CRP/FNR family transcriptional activator FtrB